MKLKSVGVVKMIDIEIKRNEIILESLQYWNQKFLRDIEREWDRIGCGYFPMFIIVKINERWENMVRSN